MYLGNRSLFVHEKVALECLLSCSLELPVVMLVAKKALGCAGDCECGRLVSRSCNDGDVSTFEWPARVFSLSTYYVGVREKCVLASRYQTCFIHTSSITMTHFNVAQRLCFQKGYAGQPILYRPSLA